MVYNLRDPPVHNRLMCTVATPAALKRATATHNTTKATLRDLQAQGVAAHAVTRLLHLRLEAKSRALADEGARVAAAQAQLAGLREGARLWTTELQRLDACVGCTHGCCWGGRMLV